MPAEVSSILDNYTPAAPDPTAAALRECWLTIAPNHGIQLIKAEQRQQLEAAGTPIPVLQAIGKEIARAAGKDVPRYLPLARCLWEAYGREGRVIALILFGSMVLVEPDYLVPMLRDLCRSCISWEDADRLAMDAVEPIVRKHPGHWIDEMAFWLSDTNKWVRRAAITIIGRLPMKHPSYTPQCLAMSEMLLTDGDVDVRRAVSFAIRMCAKSDAQLACAFLQTQVSAANAACAWVLCDVIKSMDRKILHQFTSLIPSFLDWKERMSPSAKERRSLESAIAVLQNTPAG